eukprot:6458353-Amphidinium_carterae.1
MQLVRKLILNETSEIATEILWKSILACEQEIASLRAAGLVRANMERDWSHWLFPMTYGTRLQLVLAD